MFSGLHALAIAAYRGTIFEERFVEIMMSGPGASGLIVGLVTGVLIFRLMIRLGFGLGVNNAVKSLAKKQKKEAGEPVD